MPESSSIFSQAAQLSQGNAVGNPDCATVLTGQTVVALGFHTVKGHCK